MFSCPKVSIILPTYNRRDLIEKSIQSVLDQTFDDFELIVIDDASTDGTIEVIEGFLDPRLIYIRHTKNQGGAIARNTGIKASKAELIAFQDSDDIWFPEKLFKQISRFKSAPKSLGAVYTQCLRWKNSQKKLIPSNRPAKKEGNLFKSLLSENFIGLPSLVVRKSCLEKVGLFDETLPRLQDWELFLRISKHFDFAFVPEPLVESFFTEGSISSKQGALIFALETILEKHLDEYKPHLTTHLCQILRLANLYRLERNIEKYRSYLIEANGLKFSFRNCMLIFASFFGLSFYNGYKRLIEEKGTQ